jgi:hypothetical protein
VGLSGSLPISWDSPRSEEARSDGSSPRSSATRRTCASCCRCCAARPAWLRRRAARRCRRRRSPSGAICSWRAARGRWPTALGARPAGARSSSSAGWSRSPARWAGARGAAAGAPRGPRALLDGHAVRDVSGHCGVRCPGADGQVAPIRQDGRPAEEEAPATAVRDPSAILRWMPGRPRHCRSRRARCRRAAGGPPRPWWPRARRGSRPASSRR